MDAGKEREPGAVSFEGMLNKVITLSTNKPVSSFGRGLKHTFTAFIATDGMYAGFAGAKTGTKLVKDYGH